MRFYRDNIRWLLAGALLAFSSSYGQTFFISVFADNLQAEFGLSHGEWGRIYAIGTGVSALVMVWAGVLTDWFRVRVLAPVTLVALTLACLAMALNPIAALVPVVIFALRFTGQGMTSHISSVAMARWFVASRGKALAFATLGYAVAESFLPMTFVALKEVMDWRTLWVISGFMALGAVPVLIVLLKEERTPKAIAEETQATGMGGRQWTRVEAMRHPLFWCFVPSVVGLSAFITALFFHQIHLGEIKGWTHAEVTRLFPIYTGVGILSMLASGILIDRFGTPPLVRVFQLPIALGFALFSWVESLSGAAVAIALVGFTHGIAATLPGAFWAEHYGTRNLGGIKSLATALMVAGSALGPWITGWGIDAGLSLSTQFLGFAAFFTASALLAALGIRLTRAP